jgi:predicted TIM-barrel fold metal-dependent hydrolase
MSIRPHAPGQAPVVDAHAHIFTLDMPLHDAPRHRPAYSFTVEDYLAALDAHGVGFGVIAAASPWADYNDYTIDCVRANPRLRGTVIVKPSVERIVLEDMAAKGIVGVRLPYIGLAELPDVTSFEHRRLFRRIADLGWHVHLHVEARRIPDLLPHLEAAGPKIVIDHLGRPEAGGGVDTESFRAIVRSVEAGRSWIKASCAYRIGPAAASCFEAFLERLGPDRLFWASDCPFVGHEGEASYAETMSWLDDLITDETARAKIFGGNAHAFYFGG